MTDYLVLQTDQAAGTISLRYALAAAIAFADVYPNATSDDLAAHLANTVERTSWREMGETWRVVPDADDLSGFRLPSVAREILRLIARTREGGYDLARSDVRETLYTALTTRLEREEAEHQPGPALMSPAKLAEVLGVDPALVEGDEVGMLFVANNEPLPTGLPEALRRTISAGRREQGWDDEGRQIGPEGERDA